MKNNQATVFLVEDDEIEAEAVHRAFYKLGIDNPICTARDGFEALKVLRGEANKEITPPILILLDINMPRMNGHEFLAELRQDSVLSDTKVFVLTTSESQKDMDRAIDMNIEGYLSKENGLEQFETVRSTLSAMSLR